MNSHHDLLFSSLLFFWNNYKYYFNFFLSSRIISSISRVVLGCFSSPTILKYSPLMLKIICPIYRCFSPFSFSFPSSSEESWIFYYVYLSILALRSLTLELYFMTSPSDSFFKFCILFTFLSFSISSFLDTSDSSSFFFFIVKYRSRIVITLN